MARRPTLFNDPNLTFSKLCAAWLLNLDSRMRVKGFARDLCAAVSRDCAGEADDLKELISENRIIPDAHLIDAKKRTVYLFEIEDTNPLSANKLRKLSHIWFRLDCIDWEMRVFLVDRYLTCWRALPLVDVWYSLMWPDPRKDASERESQQRDVELDWEATHRQATVTAINFPAVKRHQVKIPKKKTEI
jgi:hypothetical protein